MKVFAWSTRWMCASMFKMETVETAEVVGRVMTSSVPFVRVFSPAPSNPAFTMVLNKGRLLKM